MHTHKRIIVLLSLLILLVPLGTSVKLLSSVTGDPRMALDAILDEARSMYQSRTVLNGVRHTSEEKIADAQVRLPVLAKNKLEVREKIVHVRALIAELNQQSDLLTMQHERSARIFHEQTEDLSQFVRNVFVRHLSEEGGMQSLLLRMFGSGNSAVGEQRIRDAAISRARQDLILHVLLASDALHMNEQALRETAGELGTELIALEQEHEDLMTQYRDTSRELDRSLQRIALSEQELQEIRSTVAGVHDEVLKLQGELARIDARLRTRAERQLIEKGLRVAQAGNSMNARQLHPEFIWPVHGPLAAGFHDANYFSYFGIPHEGIDIVAPMKTPVASAADGVVFLVKDGGLTGYTYVLIGHRDGFATLYGHLSTVTVSPGDEVTQGQIIGTSGGELGTPGAGLMTTGPHLHFEVIQRGENIDPSTVLQ